MLSICFYSGDLVSVIQYIMISYLLSVWTLYEQEHVRFTSFAFKSLWMAGIMGLLEPVGVCWTWADVGKDDTSIRYVRTAIIGPR